MSSEIDRGDVERIVRRAIELESAAAPGTPSHETLPETDVLAIGRDLGIGERHVRTALAELHQARLVEHAHPNRGSTRLDRWVGPREVRVVRFVPTPPGAALDALDRRFKQGEVLQRVRLTDDTGVWERGGDVVSEMKRFAKELTGKGRLGRNASRPRPRRCSHRSASCSPRWQWWEER
jgi:hypothetical protein